MATREIDIDGPEVGTAIAAYREPQQLARREMVGGLLRPVAKPADVLQAQEETREVITSALKEDRDYGVIPGTKKATLFVSGADRACAAFALAPQYEIIEQEIDHDRPNAYVKRSWEWHPEIRGKKVWSEEPGQSEGLYRYVIRCVLIHRESGAPVGSGLGSCSTMESKYIDRPRDLENTVLKMAKKRAFVDATLTTLGLHDQFTQDVEDNPEVFGAGREQASAGSDAKPAAPACPKCGGPMWDNTKRVAENKAAGKKPGPQFKCRKKEGCDGLYWEGQWPPKEEGVDEQPEPIEGREWAVNQLVATAKYRGADAQFLGWIEGIVKSEGGPAFVRDDVLAKMQANMDKVYGDQQERAERALSHAEDEFGWAPAADDDDDVLPF